MLCDKLECFYWLLFRLGLALEHRELLISPVRHVLPLPSSESEAEQMAESMLADEATLARVRARLLSLLAQLRDVGMRMVEAIAEWRTKLRVSSSHWRRLPDDEVLYWHKGETPYPRKMAADLAFFPAPVAADPLLLDWFGAHLPWMVANLPSVASRLPDLADPCGAR